MIKNLKALFLFSILYPSAYCSQAYSGDIHVSGGSTFVHASGGSSVILGNSAIPAGQWIIENITSRQLFAGFIGILIIIMCLRSARNAIVNSDNTPTITDAGIAETNIIEIPDINDIVISNIGKLVVSHTENSETLTISADKNIMPHLKYEIHNNQLYLGIKNNVKIKTNTPIIFSACVKHLNAIKASNDTCAEINSSFTANNLTVTASHGAKIISKPQHSITSYLTLYANNNSLIEINALAQTVACQADKDSKINAQLQTHSLTAIGNNGSTITVSGTTEIQNVKLYNASKYYAYELSSAKATITATNASEAQVSANSDIIYTLENASSLYCKGNAKLQGTGKNNSTVRQMK